MNLCAKIVLLVLQLSLKDGAYGDDVTLKTYRDITTEKGFTPLLQTPCRSGMVVANFASSPFVGVIEDGKLIRRDLEKGTKIFGIACNNEGQLVTLVENSSGLCQFRRYQEPGSSAVSVQSVDVSLCSRNSIGILIDGDRLYLGGGNTIRNWATSNSDIIDKSTLQTIEVPGSRLNYPGTFTKRGNVLFTAISRPRTGVAMYINGRLVDQLSLRGVMGQYGMPSTLGQFLAIGENGELFISFFATSIFTYRSLIVRVAYSQYGFDTGSVRTLEHTSKGNFWQVTYSQGKLATYLSSSNSKIRIFEVIKA